jgi:hypothetical protein
VLSILENPDLKPVYHTAAVKSLKGSMKTLEHIATSETEEQKAIREAIEAKSEEEKQAELLKKKGKKAKRLPEKKRLLGNQGTRLIVAHLENV